MRKSDKFIRKKARFKTSANRQRRRLRTRTKYAMAVLPHPWLEDSLAQLTNKSVTHISASATVVSPSPSRSSSSYFLCNICSRDTEEEEPVISFCGHIFCWPCLYHSIIFDGSNRLRGACPTCKSAVDLCPRTKTVCPIYYAEGPQAFLPKRLKEVDRSGQGKIKDDCDSKSKDGCWSKSDGCNKSETMKRKEDLNRFVKIDPSKRPSDKRPDVYSSFISNILLNAGAVKEALICHMHVLFSKWKSTKAKLNPIIEEIQILSEELSLQLLNEHEQGMSAVTDLLSGTPVKIQGTNSLASYVGVGKNTFLTEGVDTKGESNDINDELQILAEELLVQLVTEHEQGTHSLTNTLCEMPVKIRRTNSLPSHVRAGRNTFLTEGVDTLPSVSFCSFLHSFPCNFCYGDATSREPIISYCGHIFCLPCFRDNISQHGFLVCPVCRSAVDISFACPVSCSREEGENQNCKMKEEWQKAVLVLDPNAVRLQIHSMIYELDHAIAVHGENFYDSIMKVLQNIDEFRSRVRRCVSHKKIPYEPREHILKFFPKEDVGQVLVKTNIKSSNISSKPFQVFPSKPSKASTSSSLFGSQLCCECCHKHTLIDPVVTYCTHIFCWHCLYFDIKNNGYNGEDGSLHGPCPVCKADNIVFSSTTSKLTIIPVCKGTELILQEHQNIEDGDSAGEVPPRPSAKRFSVRELNKMKVCVSRTMQKIKRLKDDMQLKVSDLENIISSTRYLIRKQKHSLFLELLDGWCWTYRGARVPNVAGTDNTETRLKSLSRYWLDAVDVESACTLSNIEVQGRDEVDLLAC